MRRTVLVLVALLAPSAAADAAEPGWTQRALALQYELAGDLPLRNTPWVGTHNSFNSQAEMGPTLSAQDSNQRIPIVDQLDQGVRSIELDLHWFPSPSGGGFAPLVCHARGEEEGHLGCTVEKGFGQVLDQVATWLRANPGQLLLLYLEDDLGSQGHDQAAAALEEKLGPLLLRPAEGGACVPLPMELTRDQARAAGKQVIAVSGCGQGAAWRNAIFDWSYREEERPRGYEDFPRCDPLHNRSTYENKLIRYYEDSTQLTATVGAPDEGITPETAGRLVRCGVDLTGLDQLTAADPRLDALVWSWAPDEPRGGNWTVPRHKVRAAAAGRLCRRRGRRHAVPRTGYEGQLLREASARRRGSVWLAIRETGGEWVALDRR